MKYQEMNEGMTYQSLVDLAFNQLQSSQLSSLSYGIPSLVGGFASKVIKCGVGHLSWLVSI